VREKDLRPKDKVRVARAGDVIPEIVERVDTNGDRGKKFSMPGHCPVCGSGVEKEGEYWLCPAGLSCEAQLAGKIQHYASREALDIEGLGEKTVEELVKKDMVKDIADLYSLTKEDFLKLEGFADKSAKQLYEAIQDSKNPGLERFIYALGIRHVGGHMALKLAEKFKSFSELKNASKNDLLEIDEVGDQIAQSIVNFFSDPQNQKILDKLEKKDVQVKEKQTEEKSDRLKGKVFVFTGELEAFTRDEAERIVEKQGGRATSGVSGNTDYLVCGKNPGSKYEKAKENNVAIIDEEKFRELIGKVQ
jgi:DNA ligase (NAD+)